MEIREKELNKKMKRLVIPFTMQILVSNSFSFIDTLMVSGLGDKAIAAISAAGQFSFIISMILSSIYVMTAYITQFYGNSDTKNVHKTLGLMLTTSVSAAIFFVLFIVLFKKEFLSLFLSDNIAISYAKAYLNIILFVYIIDAVKDSYKEALDAIGQVKIGLYIGIVCALINTILNYALIYGKFGFKSYGVRGSAISTLISEICSLAILLAFVYKKKFYINASIKALLSYNLAFAKEVYRKVIPLIINLFNNISPETKTMFSRMLYIQSIIIIANFLNNIWIIGVFRAGGDNLFTMKIIIITTWFIALPLVFVGTYIFKLQVEIIYVFFEMEEVSKAIMGYFRYKSNKWANNLVKNMAE